MKKVQSQRLHVNEKWPTRAQSDTSLTNIVKDLRKWRDRAAWQVRRARRQGTKEMMKHLLSPSCSVAVIIGYGQL